MAWCCPSSCHQLVTSSPEFGLKKASKNKTLKIRSKKDTDEEKINDNQNQDWMSTFHQKKSVMIDTTSPKTSKNDFKQMFSEKGGNKVFNEMEVPNKDILNEANNKITLNSKNGKISSDHNNSEDSEYDF